MAMLMGGPPPPPPEPVVLDAGWDGVGGHAPVVAPLCLFQSSCNILTAAAAASYAALDMSLRNGKADSPAYGTGCVSEERGPAVAEGTASGVRRCSS